MRPGPVSLVRFNLPGLGRRRFPLVSIQGLRQTNERVFGGGSYFHPTNWSRVNAALENRIKFALELQLLTMAKVYFDYKHMELEAMFGLQTRGASDWKKRDVAGVLELCESFAQKMRKAGITFYHLDRDSQSEAQKEFLDTLEKSFPCPIWIHFGFQIPEGYRMEYSLPIVNVEYLNRQRLFENEVRITEKELTALDPVSHGLLTYAIKYFNEWTKQFMLGDPRKTDIQRLAGERRTRSLGALLVIIPHFIGRHSILSWLQFSGSEELQGKFREFLEGNFPLVVRSLMSYFLPTIAFGFRGLLPSLSGGRPPLPDTF